MGSHQAKENSCGGRQYVHNNLPENPMTNPLEQDLGGVVLLPCPFCGGNADTYFGHITKRHYVSCMTENCGMTGPDADTYESAISAWNARTHSAEIAGALRDAEGWQPIETAPRDGSRILAMIRWSWSDGTDGEAQDVIYWYAGGKFWVCGTPMNYVQGLDEGVEPTHWRPLPAPPTQDSAMQHGGGGE